MKIERLDIRAFGCFSDVALDLTQAEQGLYLIYGNNEAGKSTALDGIRQWLYEFDRKKTIDFLHKNKNQRVGGVVAANGQRLACLRKRGDRDTLLGADGKTVLPSSVLQEFLHGIDENRFRSTFGINRDQLAAGGREIAEGRGDLGQALFSAGSGLIHLRRIQNGLECGAKKLFVINGKNQDINSCLTKCAKLKQDVTEAQLSVAAFKDQERRLFEAIEERRRSEEEQDLLQRRKDELTRLAQARQPAARRALLLEDLRVLQDSVRLRPDFAQEFHVAEGNLKGERGTLEKELAEMNTLDEELQTLPEQPAILLESARLDLLRNDVGGYHDAQNDLPSTRTQRNVKGGEAKQILRRLGREPDLAEEKVADLRLDERTREQIRSLGNARGQRLQSYESSAAEVGRVQQLLVTTESSCADLPVLPDVAGLDALVQRVLRLGHIEDDRAAAEATRTHQELHLEQALARLPLWSGTAGQILKLPVPSPADVEWHRNRLERAGQQVTDDLNTLQGLRDQLAQLKARLQHIQGGGAVPSEVDLAQERERRERGWRLVRGAWLEGSSDQDAINRFIEELPAAGSLAQAYETSVQRSDDLGDRLRREASRVGEQAAAQAEQTATVERLVDAEAAVARAEAGLAQAQVTWQALWQPAGIMPRMPPEMQNWLVAWQRLRQAADDRQVHAQTQAATDAVIADAVASLRAALAACGGVPGSVGHSATLSDWLEVARKRLADVENQRRRRETLDADLLRLRRERDSSRLAAEREQRSWEQWQRSWALVVARIGLDGSALPDEADRRLESLSEFWRKVDEWKGLQSRIEGMEQRIERFGRQVQELVGQLEGPDAMTVAPAEAAAALNRLVKLHTLAGRQAQDRANKQAMHQQLGQRIQERMQNIAALESALERLRQEAGTPAVDAVPEAIRRSQQRRETDQALADSEAVLRSLAGLAPFDNFCAQAAAAAVRDLDAEGMELDRRLREIAGRVRELGEHIGDLRKGLQEMRERSGAGEAATALESELALLRRHTEEYAALVLAGKVLEIAIRRYRDRNRTGLLEDASRLFSQLTCSSFDRLEIGEDEAGNPLLQGVRPDNKLEPVGVNGMSDGTCDQLYLALRLANLARYVDAHGPFPFIIDDILLNFDNERAVAALHALADLSKKTQILFFTHHQHLVDLARKNLPADVVHILHLGNGIGSTQP